MGPRTSFSFFVRDPRIRQSMTSAKSDLLPCVQVPVHLLLGGSDVLTLSLGRHLRSPH